MVFVISRPQSSPERPGQKLFCMHEQRTSPLTHTGEKERGICWSQKYFLIYLPGQEG
jgi:hypothetical protein